MKIFALSLVLMATTSYAQSNDETNTYFCNYSSNTFAPAAAQYSEEWVTSGMQGWVYVAAKGADEKNITISIGRGNVGVNATRAEATGSVSYQSTATRGISANGKNVKLSNTYTFDKKSLVMTYVAEPSGDTHIVNYACAKVPTTPCSDADLKAAYHPVIRGFDLVTGPNAKYQGTAGVSGEKYKWNVETYNPSTGCLHYVEIYLNQDCSPADPSAVPVGDQYCN